MNLQKDFEKAQKLRNNGQAEEAISLYKKIRENSLQIKKNKLATECLHMIGVAYYQDKKYSEAVKYLKDSLNEFKQSSNEESAGFVLRDLGSVARAQKKLKDAQKYFKESIQLLQKVKNFGHVGITKSKLGRVYADEGNFKKAMKEIESGIKLLERSKEKFFLSNAYLDKAKVNAMQSLSILNSFSKKDEFTEIRKCIENFL